MSVKRTILALREETTTEHVLLLVFIIPSLYMFVESFEFSSEAQHFPQLTTGMVILLGLLLIFRQHLPGPLRRLVVDEVDVLEAASQEPQDQQQTEDETTYEEEEESTTEETVAAEETDEPASAERGTVAEESEVEAKDTVEFGAMILGGMCIGYMIGSFLVGMLWMTPLFVIAYMWWRDKSIYAIVGLALLSFAVAFAFYEIIGLPIEEGYIHEVFL